MELIVLIVIVFWLVGISIDIDKIGKKLNDIERKI